MPHYAWTIVSGITFSTCHNPRKVNFSSWVIRFQSSSHFNQVLTLVPKQPHFYSSARPGQPKFVTPGPIAAGTPIPSAIIPWSSAFLTFALVLFGLRTVNRLGDLCDLFLRHSFPPPSCKLEGRNLCFILSWNRKLLQLWSFTLTSCSQCHTVFSVISTFAAMPWIIEKLTGKSMNLFKKDPGFILLT